MPLNILRGSCAGLVTIAALLNGACVTGAAQEDLGNRRWDPPTSCPLQPSGSQSPAADALAVQCAQAFVARNGYTEVPAVADSTQLAFESIEWARSLSELKESRRSMLAPQAYGICQRSGHHRFTVVFRYARGAFGGDVSALDRTKIGRAVTMDSALANLRVQHQDIYLAAVEVPHDGCRLLRDQGR